MQDLEILFGNRLTAISGQNGTGKSTILGLVGQIFDYKGKEKTKNNLPFATKYSEIFRFCSDYDKSGTHKYDAFLTDKENNEIIRNAESRFIKGEGKKGRFRIDIGDRNVAGTGALNHPVIYLGLKRLFPLAQEKDDSIKVRPLKLDDNEKKFYSKYAKDILILLDRSITPQDIKSPNKEFLAMETSRYSNLGNSAGQDNIGQLLTSILSFKELRNKKSQDYDGGILLIDEIDATLYAGSQINLIKRLYKFSIDYNLQIIFTTHSLEILELLKEKSEWDTCINFLEVKNNKVHNIINPSIKEIKNKILVQTNNKEKVDKIPVLCEDDITESWCKNLLKGTKFKAIAEIKKVPMSAETLIELSKKNHPAFKQMLFILDGDKKDKLTRTKRVVGLPGTMPEKVFYKYLFELDEEDDFWDNDFNLTKQVCFNGYLDISSPNLYRDWLTKNAPYLGSRLLNRWKKDNLSSVNEFRENFEKEVERIIK